MNNNQEISMLSSPMKHSQIAFLRSSLDTQQSNSRSNRIADLYSKFVSLNSQVTVDHDLSAFNLIEYDHKDIKMDFDRQLVQAKLKRLENNAELKRINMELEHRRKKKLKIRSKDQQEPPKISYLSTYRQLQQEREKQEQNHQAHSDSQEENSLIESQKPSNIRYYSELRRHPKILDYTVSLACSRELQRKEEANSKSQKKEDYKKQIQQAKNHIPPPSQLLKPSTPPQKLAQNIFRRIYTKRNKERPVQEVRRQGRLTKFMNRQQDIIDGLNSKTISKDLYKKLKQRLHDIATEIYINEKKFQPKKDLPRIALNTINFSSRK